MTETPTYDYNEMVGAWILESAITTDDSGRVTHPFGEEPAGVLMYTPDHWVSATITAVGPEPAPGACFYAGPVVLSGSGIEHHVEVGVPPFGPGTVQKRQVRLMDGKLELAAHTTHPVAQTTRLTWRRMA